MAHVRFLFAAWTLTIVHVCVSRFRICRATRLCCGCRVPSAVGAVAAETEKMKPYQREFIEFAIATGVLKFGQFTLKSGRVSPYFFNAGLFCTGAALAKLGRCYAAAVRDHADRHKADILFGPAYKGYAQPVGEPRKSSFWPRC